MKKVFLAMMFLVAGLLTACGVYVNDNEVGHVDPLIQSDKELTACDVNMRFYRHYDTQRENYWWYEIILTNYQYRGAEVKIFAYDNDVKGGELLHAWLGEQEDEKKQPIDIKDGQKLLLEIKRPNEIDGWYMCDDCPRKFKLEI